MNGLRLPPSVVDNIRPPARQIAEVPLASGKSTIPLAQIPAGLRLKQINGI
jgi:hypothetical protein